MPGVKFYENKLLDYIKNALIGFSPTKKIFDVDISQVRLAESLLDIQKNITFL